MAIRTIQVNLSADITNFQQNISRAERSIGSLGSELNNNMRRISSNTQLMLAQLGNNASVMDTLRVRATGLNNSLGQQTSYVSRLQNELNSARTNFGATSTQVRNLELQLLRAATAEQTMTNQLARLNQEMSINARMGRLGQSMQGLQGAGMGMTAGVTFPLLLAGKAAFNDAKEAQEALNLYKVSFGEMTNVIDDWAKKMEDKYKLNQTNLKKYAGNLNLILQNMGLDSKQSSKMSTDLVTRAIDISSLRNVDFKQVYEKIRSGLTGESEPLMQLGINVKVEKLKNFAINEGLIKKGQELNETGKAYAAYLSILQQTTKDQGDFGRTMGDTANQIRIYKEQMQTFSETIGTNLTNMFGKFAQVINPLLEKFNSFTPEVQKNILIFGTLAASIGPALIGVSLIGRALTIAADGAAILSRGYVDLQVAMVRIQTMSLATASAIAATTISILVLAASAYAIQDNWDTMPSYFSNMWDSIKTGFVAVGSLITVGMQKLGSVVVSVIRATYGLARDFVAKTFDLMAKIPQIGEKFIGLGDSIRNSGNPFEKWEIAADANVEDAKQKFIELAGVYHEATAKMNKDQDKIKASFTMDRLKEKFGLIKSDIDAAIKPPETSEITGINEIPTRLSDVANGAGKQAKKLEDVMKDMVDKIRQQAKSFADAFNLFDNVSLEKVSGERLFVRLDAQVKAMSKWKDAISNLKARLGAGSPLLQELISKGPQAAGQILSLQRLSDTRLAEYASLYGQKSDIALAMAGPSVTSQFMQEKKLENIILNITGNTIATDNIDLIANKIIDKLKAAGVM